MPLIRWLRAETIQEFIARNKRTFFLAEKSCTVHHTETVLTLAAVVVAVALCRCRRRRCRASLMVCCCDTTEHKEGDNQLGASRPLLGLLRPLECTRRLPHHFPCRRHLPHLLPCQRQQTNDTRCIKHHQKHKRQQPTQKHFLSGSKKANNSITYHGWLHWCRHSSRRLPRLRRRVLSCWFVVGCCVERCVP